MAPPFHVLNALPHVHLGQRRLASPHDAVLDVGHGRGVDGSLDFQVAPAIVELIEQLHALAEKCEDEVDLHLVEKSSVEALLHDVRATGHRDVFVAGSSVSRTTSSSAFLSPSDIPWRSRKLASPTIHSWS
jgi:hypothetical protein